MTSAALAAALADIDTVFNGFASPNEVGCARCHLPEEIAFLRTPYTRVPPDVLRRFVFEVSDHFDDHAASMRRLLPQAARAMADGSLDGVGWGTHGLSRVDWRSWPAEQANSIEAFVYAWWEDVLTTPEPPYPVHDVFETCATIIGTMTPLLDRWVPHPVADAHLPGCADEWLYHLVVDDSPLSWWYLDDEKAVVAELQSWLASHAPARLRAQGEPDLAMRAELLALPYDERWAHPYWASPSATN
ncbi:hypothetical protein ACFOZ0_29280 [Streptomyces yaanensis]|uniref:Uncharacterized protein n=1 Tax=Streptomyces yaanensis TaxID=1142239 RepID=A0ABV7SK55_9ACTN|nr:hypothetical protein [Streptomyces sp. CGMCC 4.7035]WNC00889.1 hypothetical protein Q2K21_24095 [Streptomyces sp. CGMCC 4.7035]